jgi:hypothetical protein
MSGRFASARLLLFSFLCFGWQLSTLRLCRLEARTAQQLRMECSGGRKSVMPTRRKRRRTPASRTFEDESLNLDELDELQIALLKLLMVRVRDFVARFGREPNEEEPLFFDVSSDLPVRAAPAEIREQIIEAAQLTGADARLLLRVFGFEDPGSSLQ